MLTWGTYAKEKLVRYRGCSQLGRSLVSAGLLHPVWRHINAKGQFVGRLSPQTVQSLFLSKATFLQYFHLEIDKYIYSIFLLQNT